MLQSRRFNPSPYITPQRALELERAALEQKLASSTEDLDSHVENLNAMTAEFQRRKEALSATEYVEAKSEIERSTDVKITLETNLHEIKMRLAKMDSDKEERIEKSELCKRVAVIQEQVDALDKEINQTVTAIQQNQQRLPFLRLQWADTLKRLSDAKTAASKLPNNMMELRV